MGLRSFFLSNLPGATFIQGGMFIPDSRVTISQGLWYVSIIIPGLVGIF